MSTNNPDVSPRLVEVIQSSEKLSPLLENAATDIRPAATAIKTSQAMTPFQPSGPSISAVLKEFAAISSQVTLRIAKSNDIDPGAIWVQYEVVICQKGALSLGGIFSAVVIRLFEVGSLEMNVSDSKGNTKKVDWEEGPIALLAGGGKVDLSRNGKLVCLFLTYKRRNASNDPSDNARLEITDL